MDELRVQREPLSPLVLFSMGTAFGLSMLLLVAFVLILTLNTDVLSQWKFYAAFPIYRGYALLILCVWLWGANVFVFHRTRVNHVFVLEADSRTSLTHVQIWQYAAMFTLLYFLSIVWYLVIGAPMFRSCMSLRFLVFVFSSVISLLRRIFQFSQSCGEMIGVFMCSTPTMCTADSRLRYW
jgi:hypothetical protein